MIKKYLILCLFCFPLEATRHVLARQRLKAELPKKIKTDDEKTANALRKLTKDMNFDDAYRAKIYYEKEKEPEMVIKCGQRLLAVGGDEEIMRKTRLQLSELFLEKKNYTEAERYASEYEKHYPGSSEIIKAEYIHIRSKYLSQSASDRDQEKTRSTIERAHAFLERHPRDTEYKNIINDMLAESYLRLIRNELRIIEHQIHTYSITKNMGSLVAAEKRLLDLKEKYLSHAPMTEKRILEAELHLAQASNKTDSIKEKETALKKIPSAPQQRTWTEATKETFIENNKRYFA